MAGPAKRSVMIAGHATSVSLEPIFWDALKRAADAERLPLSALVARIDAERIVQPDPPNLASAIRVWIVERLLAAELAAAASAGQFKHGAGHGAEHGGDGEAGDATGAS